MVCQKANKGRKVKDAAKFVSSFSESVKKLTGGTIRVIEIVSNKSFDPSLLLLECACCAHRWVEGLDGFLSRKTLVS